MELMRWSTLVDDYGMELRKGSLESPATDVFAYTEEGEKRWKDLKNRVVEHVRIWHSGDDNLEVNFGKSEHKFLFLKFDNQMFLLDVISLIHHFRIFFLCPV